MIRMTQTSGVIHKSTKGPLVNLKVYCISLTLVLIVLNDRQVTAWKLNSRVGLDCEEVPPNCQLQSLAQYVTRDDLMFNGSSTQLSVAYSIDSSLSQPVCSLNPFKITPSLHNISSLVVMSMTCSQSGTRIVITTGSEYTMSSAILTLWITNCAIYWKDLSKLGRLFVLFGITLHDWRDEFMNNEPEYSDTCVQIQQPRGVSNKSDMDHTIAGCTNVVEIEIMNTIDRRVSPVFTRHLWPSVTELRSIRYRFSANDTKALAKTMPSLQSITIIDGEFSLISLDFPWNAEEVIVPYNIKRSEAFNQQYYGGLLPRDVIGRGIILKSVTLSASLNISFNGFLHSVGLINCNLTHIGPLTFTNLTGLLMMSVSNNQITHLDKACLSGLNQMITVDLSNNSIQSLPREIFSNVTNLLYINLSGNDLTYIYTALFMKLPHLKILDLSRNSLVSESDNVGATTSISYSEFKRIDLSRNNLTEFPAWLFNWKFLEVINLNGNRLSFRSISLALQKFNISSVYMASPTSKQTKIIYLLQNEFTGFDIGKLDLALRTKLLVFLTLFRVNFGEEVFNCDCSMYELYQHLSNFDTRGLEDNQRSTFQYNRNGFSCLHPTELRGQPLTQAPVTALGCDEPLPTCPKHCRCWVRSVDRVVKVNCSYKNLTQLPNHIPDRSIQLDFSHNKLVDLQYDFPNYFTSLQTLDLSNNDLTYIDGSMFEAQVNISDLLLHGNRLSALPKEVQTLSHTTRLTLAGNRLACDCNTLWLKHWLISRRHQVTDIDDVLCGSGQAQVLTLPITEVPDTEFVCIRDTRPIIIGVSTLASFLVLLMAIILGIYKFRGEIRVMLYFKLGWRPFDQSDDTNILNKEFDAFVSYHHQDSEWVRQELRPHMEDVEPRFRLCLHQRDFVAGATVSDNICSAVDISRRMILLLSKAFLQSHWCHEEFRQAHYKVMKERANYLILVLCEDVSIEELDGEMQPYLRTNTYLRRDSRWFWEKLRYAMPQKPLLELKRGLNVPENADWSGVYALARAQQKDMYPMGGNQGQNAPVTNGSHRHYTDETKGEIMETDITEDYCQIRDDIHLVEDA